MGTKLFYFVFETNYPIQWTSASLFQSKTCAIIITSNPRLTARMTYNPCFLLDKACVYVIDS